MKRWSIRMDALLYNDLRNLLNKGKTLIESRNQLLSKGYQANEISEAVSEYYKDEATKRDDKLIALIEERLGDREITGELLQDIFADLVKKYKPFEVEKALLRARIGKKDLPVIFSEWSFYSYVQIGILLSTLVLGVFYKLFFIATAFILIEMIIASLGIPTNNAKWRQEITVMPFGGINITDGIFGYNSLIGNYWRFWVMDPAIVLLIFFLMLAIVGIFINGFLFSLFSLILGTASYYSYSITDPTKSGPPYDR
jgi:hypothetical protein